MTQQVSKPQNDTLGALPTWDLSDLYPSADSEAYRADCEAVDQDAKAFMADFPAKRLEMTGPFNWSAYNNQGAAAIGDHAAVQKVQR